MTTRPRRIVFLGTHGQYNIGDELLLDTFLTQLGPEHSYVVNSYDPDYTRRQLAGRFAVRVIDTARDRVALLRALLTCDILVFGGGSIIKELYASTGRQPYSTLWMILAIVTFTRRVARKPIAMLNVGVGPIRTEQGQRLARRILRQVDLVTVRDARSVTTCRSVGVEPVLATDAVFSASRATLLGHGEVGPAGIGGPLRVAINLNFDIENPSNWELFLERLAVALEQVHRTYPIEVHTLPMQVGFKERDDVTVIDEFASRLPSITVVRHDLPTHGDAARLIASCDLVVAERLHAIVMASILGVPTFVLAYDVKVRELATILDIEPWSLDINEPFDAAEVAARIAALVEQRAEVAEHLRARSSDLNAAALSNFGAARTWVAAAH